MLLLAPAKINLNLHVGPLRADGYHPLVSWMCRVALFDNLELRRSPKPGVHFHCTAPGMPADQHNLAYQAAMALLPPGSGVDLSLEKSIPAGGGLGGGSSDAARVLLAMNRLFRPLPDAELARRSARLGSDVPFFMHGPSSLCTGRGEIVRPLPEPRANWALLIFPAMRISTADVYRRFDQIGLAAHNEDLGDERAHFSACQRAAALPARDLLATLRNDLEAPAFAAAPALANLRSAAEALAARPVRMSGSGSTLFTLYDQREEADAAAAAIAQKLNIKVGVFELAAPIDDDLEQAPA
jgi:4-diphosphocytidyl-2-C-methyl-D-erythritol kinase